MNENDYYDQAGDYNVHLSPWLSAEYTTIAPAPKTTLPKRCRPTPTDMAEVYKVCQEEVLARLAETPDNLGRSQQWKVNAIREDIANKRTDTRVMEWLAKETIALAERYL